MRTSITTTKSPSKKQPSGPDNNSSKRGFPFWLLIFLLLLFTTGVSARSQKLLNAAQILAPGIGIDEIATSGISGINGIDGINGEKGAKGSDGSQGTNGEKGQDGSAGSSGVAGANGSAGADGAQGIAGSNDCISGICVSRQTTSPGTQESGNINIDGAILADSLTATTVTATTLAGNGSGLTALNASNIASGTLADGRLSGSVTLLGNTFNGASQLVQLTGGGLLPVLNGSNLTALNASALASGILADGRLSSNVALLNASNIFSVGQTILSGAAGTNGLIVKGAASQTANLQEWRDSSGTVKASVAANGAFTSTGANNFSVVLGTSMPNTYGTTSIHLDSSNNTILHTYSSFYFYGSNKLMASFVANDANTFYATRAVDKPLVAKGFSAQTANLQEWQNSSGAVLAAIGADGKIYLGDSSGVNTPRIYSPSGAQTQIDHPGGAGTGTIVNFGGDRYNLGNYTFRTNASTQGLAIINTTAAQNPLLVMGATSQSGNLTEWQNSAGSKLASVSSAGRIYAGDGTTTTYSYIAPDGSIGMRSSGNEWTFTYASTGVNLNTAIGASNFSPGGVGTTPGRLDTGGGGLSLSERFNDVYIRNFSPGFTVAQFGTASGSTVAQLLTPVASGKGLVIKANATTPGNLQEWQDSSSTLLMGVTSSGGIRFNTAAITMSQSANSLTFVGDVGKAGVVRITNDFGDISTLEAARFQGGTFFSTVGMEINYSQSVGHGTALIKGGGQNIIGFTDPNSGVYVNFYKPVKALDSSTVALAVRGATSQTANLQEWQNSAGTVLSRITAAGDLYTPGGSVIALGSQYLWNSNGIKYNVDAGNSHTFFVGGSEVMRVDSTANVGIGDDTSPDAKLDVSNTSTAGAVLQLTNSAGTCDHTPGAVTETVSCSSDARLKTDIASAASVLSEINGLHVYDYTIISTGQKATGLIAQDVMQTNPGMVHMGEDGYYKVDSYNSWKILKGIQELSSVQDNLLLQLTNALDKTEGDIDATNDLLANQGLRIDQLSATLNEYAAQLSDHQSRIEILEAEIQALKQQ